MPAKTVSLRTGLVNVMYPEPLSNSSERVSVQSTVAAIAAIRGADARNGLSSANADSVPA